MAQIPLQVAPQLTPPPAMNPQAAGKPGLDLAQTGDAMQQFSELGIQVADRIKKAQDEGLMLDAENKIGSDIEKAHAQLANWTDYTNADSLKQDTATSLQQKYADQYGNRPDLWRYIQPYLGKELNQYNRVVDEKSAQLTVHFNKAALIDSQLRTESDAANETDIDGMEKDWAVQDAKTDVMVRNGTIMADEAEVAKRQLRTRTIQTQVNRAANPLNLPQIMQQQLDRLKTYEGKGYVDPDALEQMQEHLGRSLEVAENRSDRVDVGKQGDSILAGYRGDPTLKDPETTQFDPMAAAKRVDDDPNVATKVKKYVRQELEEEAGVTQKMNGDRDQKQLDDLDPQVETGKLTSVEIKRRMNMAPGSDQWISRRAGDHMLSRSAQLQRENRSLNLQERTMRRQEQAEQSTEAFARIISQPGYLSKTDIPDMLKSNPGLKYTDALHAVEVKSSSQDPFFQSAQKVLQDAVNSQWLSTSDYGEANVALLKAAKEQNLSGSQLIEYARQIVKPAVESQIKNNLDWILYPDQKRAAEVAQKTHKGGFFDKSAPLSSPGSLDIGTIKDGYQFTGGDPSKPTNWKAVPK